MTGPNTCTDPRSSEHRAPGLSNSTRESGALDEQSTSPERGGEEEKEAPSAEMMTDGPAMEDKDNNHQDHHHDGLPSEKHGTDPKHQHHQHHPPERKSNVQKGLAKGSPGRQQDPAHCSMLFNTEGFEDFEEFVLDFDDYDLLESIHTQLASPPEPVGE